MSPAASRVTIRSPSERDRNPFSSAMLASTRLHAHWLPGMTNAATFDQMLARVGDHAFEPLLACRMEDGAIVGFFNIGQIVRGRLQSAYLGYGAVAEHAGNGYMTEAMRLVLRRAFTDLALHRLEANIQPGNARSIALVERSGFVKEGFSERYLKIAGRWRDHERWAIRVEQWRELRSARS